MPNRISVEIIRYIPSTIGLFLFAFFIFLYIKMPDIYFDILSVWSFEPYKQPFIDSYFLYNVKKCWLEGVDIYQAIPCDIFPDNKMPYSPLWPRLPFLPSDSASFGLPLALLTNCLAILSTLVLPAVRTPREALILTLTLTAPPVVFGIERNNVDVWMYILLCGIVLLCFRNLPFRILGYVLTLFAGLLKYYPILWLILVLRERLAFAVAIGVTSLLCFAGFFWLFWPEIVRGLANLPYPTSVIGVMSVLDIPRGLLTLMAHDDTPAGLSHRIFTLVIRLAITLYIVIGACRLGAKAEFRDWLAASGEKSGVWLVAGCATIVGCYLAGPNLPYRAIFMLMIVAALLAMARAQPLPALYPQLKIWPIMILALLWAKVAIEGLIMLLKFFGAPAAFLDITIFLVWWAEKLTWIVVIRFFLAIVIAWGLNSRAFVDLQILFSRLSQRGSAPLSPLRRS